MAPAGRVAGRRRRAAASAAAVTPDLVESVISPRRGLHRRRAPGREPLPPADPGPDPAGDLPGCAVQLDDGRTTTRSAGGSAGVASARSGAAGPACTWPTCCCSSRRSPPSCRASCPPTSVGTGRRPACSSGCPSPCSPSWCSSTWCGPGTCARRHHAASHLRPRVTGIILGLVLVVVSRVSNFEPGYLCGDFTALVFATSRCPRSATRVKRASPSGSRSCFAAASLGAWFLLDPIS